MIRALDQLDATPLIGIGDNPQSPFVSPNGQWVGYFDAAGFLKKVPINGGPAVPLCRLDQGPPRSGAWGEDGAVVFATDGGLDGLLRVSDSGGEPTALTNPDRVAGEVDHILPSFLPGGHALLFTISTAGGIDNNEIAVLDLRTGKYRVLIHGGSDAHYVPSGHLVYAAGGTLRAIAFDLDRLEVMGAAATVVQPVSTTPAGAADFDVARTARLSTLMEMPAWSSATGCSGSIARAASSQSMPNTATTSTHVCRPTGPASR